MDDKAQILWICIIFSGKTSKKAPGFKVLWNFLVTHIISSLKIFITAENLTITGNQTKSSTLQWKISFRNKRFLINQNQSKTSNPLCIDCVFRKTQQWRKFSKMAVQTWQMCTTSLKKEGFPLKIILITTKISRIGLLSTK